MARERQRRKRNGTHVLEPRKEKKKDISEKPTLAQIALDARKAGMTYGEYVMRMGL